MHEETEQPEPEQPVYGPNAKPGASPTEKEGYTLTREDQRRGGLALQAKNREYRERFEAAMVEAREEGILLGIKRATQEFREAFTGLTPQAIATATEALSPDTEMRYRIKMLALWLDRMDGKVGTQSKAQHDHNINVTLPPEFAQLGDALRGTETVDGDPEDVEVEEIEDDDEPAG